MDSMLIETLRSKLRTRTDNLDPTVQFMFHWHLLRLWDLVQSNTIFKSILDEAQTRNSDVVERLKPYLGSNINPRGPFIVDSAEGQAVVSSLAIDTCIRKNQNLFVPEQERKLGSIHTSARDKDELNLAVFKSKFVEPLIQYLDDRLELQHLLLYFLIKYKQLAEWFDREQILHIYKNAKRPQEDYLALHMYRYLFLQGLEFHVKPFSIVGEIDFISELRKQGRLLFDAKIFGDGRRKDYIVKAYNQIYTYLCQYNQPWGALAIYDINDKPLSFALPVDEFQIPFIQHNGKTVFMVIIDIARRPSASQRGPLETVEIDQGDLISSIVTT